MIGLVATSLLIGSDQNPRLYNIDLDNHIKGKNVSEPNPSDRELLL